MQFIIQLSFIIQLFILNNELVRISGWLNDHDNILNKSNYDKKPNNLSFWVLTLDKFLSFLFSSFVAIFQHDKSAG